MINSVFKRMLLGCIYAEPATLAREAISESEAALSELYGILQDLGKEA